VKIGVKVFVVLGSLLFPLLLMIPLFLFTSILLYPIVFGFVYVVTSILLFVGFALGSQCKYCEKSMPLWRECNCRKEVGEYL